MRPLYENHEVDLETFYMESHHFSPHVHNSFECVYVTEGVLELGVGKELFHMERGDFAIVFPGQIHHAQVFGDGKNRSSYIIAAPSHCGKYQQTMLQNEPVNPVIREKDVHTDVVFALHGIFHVDGSGEEEVLRFAFLQIILARCLPFFEMKKRQPVEDRDLVDRIVAYVSEHCTEPMALSSMAKDLYVSPYTLSRTFSGVFHMNFNEYVNESRLDLCKSMLRHTNQSITDVWINAGFESQRTFNRVFREKIRMTPKEYRKKYQDMESSAPEFPLPKR